ncbi:hypothetical protein FA15DRAFT_626191 [Coprinopsis marcescibilis]|uniref:Uncharacterized protein n=1 Tax=Coprinopsis marcescibilis TaxID=230819 RepID=A0A5C3KIH2_COPMA|nr:hypothetical protein FA15DRAFT_626191 [Coprinopsis marcescibilis]
MTISNKRYHAVAHRLPRLPRELVHGVLDDLPLTKVLELICNHNIPYVEQCVTTHISYGKLLSGDQLQILKKWFALYLRVCSARRSDPHPKVRVLNKEAHILLEEFADETAFRVFEKTIASQVFTEMLLYKPFFPVLRRFSKVSIPEPEFWDGSSVDYLEQIYDILDANEVALNTLKVNQLMRMADFLERFPTLLRTCRDKLQETKRNPKHRIDYLRVQASRMPVRQILDNQWVGRSIFAHTQFYILPYDRVLRVFLKILQRYPPSNDTKSDSETKKEEDDDDDDEDNDGEPKYEFKLTKKVKPEKGRRVPHEYPGIITFVLEGMALHSPRYPGEPPAKVSPRVLHSKYSHPSHKGRGGVLQPTFFVPDDFPNPKNMKKWEGLDPMAEKDFEWLEAFLSICEYMSRMQVPWSQTQTVGQHWHAHV